MYIFTRIALHNTLFKVYILRAFPSGRAVVNRASFAVSALRASIPNAKPFEMMARGICTVIFLVPLLHCFTALHDIPLLFRNAHSTKNITRACKSPCLERQRREHKPRTKVHGLCPRLAYHHPTHHRRRLRPLHPFQQSRRQGRREKEHLLPLPQKPELRHAPRKG